MEDLNNWVAKFLLTSMYLSSVCPLFQEINERWCYASSAEPIVCEQLFFEGGILIPMAIVAFPKRATAHHVMQKNYTIFEFMAKHFFSLETKSCYSACWDIIEIELPISEL